MFSNFDYFGKKPIWEAILTILLLLSQRYWLVCPTAFFECLAIQVIFSDLRTEHAMLSPGVYVRFISILLL